MRTGCQGSEKHKKKKNKEIYLQEEKAAELKQFSEPRSYTPFIKQNLERA